MSWVLLYGSVERCRMALTWKILVDTFRAHPLPGLAERLSSFVKHVVFDPD